MCSCRVRNIISAAAWESALQKYHISFADYTLPIFLPIAFDTCSWVLAIAEQAWTLASMPAQGSSEFKLKRITRYVKS